MIKHWNYIKSIKKWFISLYDIANNTYWCDSKKNSKVRDPNWPNILDHLYRVLIIGLGLGKINTLLNLISRWPDIDKKNLTEKDASKTKYELLTNRLRTFKDPKAIIEYLNNQ